MALATAKLSVTKKDVQKDLSVQYVVSTNDVGFYANQPIYLKISVCDKNEQLCTEVNRSPVFTLTKKGRAMHLVLSGQIPYSEYKAIIDKRKIYWEDAKIKIQVIYGRSDMFAKFVEGTYLHKDLVARVPISNDFILKESTNEDTGVVEFSHLLLNYK
jgi:hypothetical protein